jgi:hypothetical protein
VTMRVLPLLCALLLGVGTALLAGCGGGDRANLLPAQDAQALKTQLQAVQQAASSRDCDLSQAALTRARSTVRSLPDAVDERIVERLLRGLDTLRAKTDDECAAPAEVTTTTVPTTTTPAEPTTTTEEQPPTTTSTETTPPTTTEPAPTVPDPDAGGGASPDPSTTEPAPAPDDGGAAPVDPGTLGDGR